MFSQLIRWQNHYSPFVVLGAPRTGSTLLTLSLREHPAALMYQELFNPTHRLERWLLGWKRAGQSNPDFLRKRLYRKMPPFVGAAGFKLIYDQPSREEFEPLIQFLSTYPRMKIIHLTRNYFESAVSAAIALQTGHWHRMSENPQKPLGAEAYPPIPVDLDWIRSRVIEWRKRQQIIESQISASEVLPLAFDDLISDFGASMERVQKFLNLTIHPLKPMTLPVRETPWRKMVDNREALEALEQELKSAGR